MDATSTSAVAVGGAQPSSYAPHDGATQRTVGGANATRRRRLRRHAAPSSSPQLHHNSSSPVSSLSGDVDSQPNVEVLAMQRIVEPAAYGADHPPVVLIALVGGDQPAVTPEELQAHLALKFRVSMATTGVCAWLGAPLHVIGCRKAGNWCTLNLSSQWSVAWRFRVGILIPCWSRSPWRLEPSQQAPRPYSGNPEPCASHFGCCRG
jgi:hypothetical protein